MTPAEPSWTRPAHGVRRILNNAADRALAAGPPSKAQEVTYAASWAATTLAACALLAIARWLSR